MKIKMITNLMIGFYVTLIFVVSFSIYNLEIQSSLFFIYTLMFIALVSFIFTYRTVRKKILQPIYKMNEIIIAYQNGDDSIKKFDSHDDEIGLMIQAFFTMKEKLDEDYAQLEKLALTDPLTGILNRRAFFEISEQILKISLRNKTSFSILLLDIDFFKKVNDVYGHLVGDDILKYLVSTVSKEIRDSDVFARYGGEEFIVMLPDTDEDGARNLAEKMRESIELNPFACEKLSVEVTVSIGVAELRGEKLLRDVIHRADEALYMAKANGRNRVEAA